MLTQGAFQEDSADFDFGGDALARRREATQDRFRRTIAAMEQSWPDRLKRSAFYPFVTWTPEGPKLGASTLLWSKGARDDVRLLALVSVACGVAVPAGALAWLARAEIEFERGRAARSAIHVAMSGIPALRSREAARRLYFAAGILDAGFFTPARLVTMCGLDSGAVDSLRGKYG